MAYILNETIAGISLFEIQNEETEEKKCELKATFEYENNEITLKNIKLLKENKFSDEIIEFLKKNMENKKEALHVSAKEFIEQLEKNKIKSQYSPFFFQKFKSDFDKLSKFSFSPSEILSRTKFVANELSSDMIHINNDILLIQNIKLFDYLEKEINMHCMRIKEFYGMHFPELSELISDNEKYLRMVIEIGNKDSLNNENKKNDESEKKNIKSAKRVKKTLLMKN